MKRFLSAFAALALTLAAAVSLPAQAARRADDKANHETKAHVRVPLNLAVLVQDDVTSDVGHELGVTADFIRALPAGSRVMVGYLTAGTMQVRQPFTDDLGQAAKSLRLPLSRETAAPYNPYVEVLEALKKFDKSNANQNVVLLISDGLDTSRGFDSDSTINSIDLQRAVREAKRRNVAVYTFYAPTVGLTGFNQLAISYGQSALNRIADETGGRAFFQGTSFVTFDSYFDNLRRVLNERYAPVS
jgi:von Willebrand factor type A domain